MKRLLFILLPLIVLTSCGSLQNLSTEELTAIQKAQYPTYNTNNTIRITYTTQDGRLQQTVIHKN